MCFLSLLPEMADCVRDVFKASGSGGLPSLKHIIGRVLIGALLILEKSWKQCIYEVSTKGGGK